MKSLTVTATASSLNRVPFMPGIFYSTALKLPSSRFPAPAAVFSTDFAVMVIPLLKYQKSSGLSLIVASICRLTSVCPSVLRKFLSSTKLSFRAGGDDQACNSAAVWAMTCDSMGGSSKSMCSQSIS